MKGLIPLVLGIFGTFTFLWMGLTVIPNLQIEHLDPQMDEEGTDVYPAPKSGMTERGRHVYAANGCIYCHSQQVRADYAGSDIDRKWGERRSAPRDYIFERPVELGKMRMGPDLANIGHRAPAEENAPAQVSPAPPNAAPGTPAGSPASTASPAAGGSPVAATQNTNPAPPSQPAGSQPSPGASAAPPNVPANQGAKPPGAPATAQVTVPSASPAQASPAQSTNTANAAVAGSSPALQKAVAAVAGAATSLGPTPSNVPPTYS